ncbi:hypothetical protein BGX29_005793 [Mortierella sp. GBA35]|nr:hypothetical protein BGX29_005793 [Mortierella sp. GBA35]
MRSANNLGQFGQGSPTMVCSNWRIFTCLEGNAGDVSSVAYLLCGSQIVSASIDKSVRLRDVRTGNPGLIMIGYTAQATEVAYSPSVLEIATCSMDEIVLLWWSMTGKRLFVLKHATEVDQVIYSPGGRDQVSVSMTGRVPHSWDPQSGERTGQLDSIEPRVLCCSFSPNGKIATAVKDGRLRLLDVSSGRCLEVFSTVIGSTRQISELSLTDATLDEVEGLSAINLELMRQRGAIAKSPNHSTT